MNKFKEFRKSSEEWVFLIDFIKKWQTFDVWLVNKRWHDIKSFELIKIRLTTKIRRTEKWPEIFSSIISKLAHFIKLLIGHLLIWESISFLPFDVLCVSTFYALITSPPFPIASTNIYLDPSSHNHHKFMSLPQSP